MHLLETLNHSHFIQMYQLEKEFYSEDYITPYEVAYRWYQRFPYTTFALAEDNQIIGFINVFPIKRAVYQQIEKGDFNDKDLTVADIIDLEEANPKSESLPMFLSCIVVAEAWRKSGVTEALLRAAVNYYKPHASRFDRIITDNLTEEGVQFSKRYGFKPLTIRNHSSQLSSQSYASFQKKVLGD